MMDTQMLAQTERTERILTFKTKQDQVADILRERVISGVYARGTKLRQSEIAEELGVSITPVREALHILEAEGYISGLSHRGLLVPEFVPAATQEIFDLRIMLERELTAFAVPNVTPAHRRAAQLPAGGVGDQPRPRSAGDAPPTSASTSASTNWLTGRRR
jgi:DNA-binding GntR family transcriptional regulator